jgi:predicted XRE-type DNA-binding protein
MTEYQKLIAEILSAQHIPRWTQSAIAQQLNVGIATVSDMANGKQTDTKDSIATALRALHKRVTRKGKV